MIRTDLAEESIKHSNYRGEGYYVENRDGITRVLIESAAASKAIGKPKGVYFTVETGDFRTMPDGFADEVEKIASVIRKLLPADGPILAAGLGNREITPDAIGPLVSDQILVTRHLCENNVAGFENLRHVAAVNPGVLGQTGIEAAQYIKKLAEIGPMCAVVVVDALAAAAPERLLRTVQITDSGIVPGSGVGNNRTALSKEALGVPVIAVGVPTVAALSNLVDLPPDSPDWIVTPREIDQAVQHAARTVAFAVNRALFPALSLEELIALVG